VSKKKTKDEKKSSVARNNEEAPAPSSGMLKEKRLGIAMLIIGALGLLILMAHAGRIPHGSLLGLALAFTTVVGLLKTAGFMNAAATAPSWRETAFGPLEDEPAWRSPHYSIPLAIIVVIAGALIGGYAWLSWVIVAALLLLLPSAIRRPGMMVFVVTAMIYVPLLGTFSLWDPWETHYGEVAREMVARDDWISLWWAHENWFWSKPILIFWSESFWLSALDVNVLPDANPSHPEWAIRLPVLTFSLCAVMVVFGSIKRIFGTRAGVLAALSLASAPHFFMLSHQAITDMYLVANIVMAMCFLALAVSTDEEEQVKETRFFGMGVGLRQLVLGGIALLAIPQAFYLITRNITFYAGEGFAFQEDTFLYGSAGNNGWDAVTNPDGVPGLATHSTQHAAVDSWWAQPISQGIFWLILLAAVFYMLRKETRSQALYMMAFYVFCALAFMGKTIPGVAIPGMIALFFLIATKRWKLLYSGALKVAPGILVVLMVAMPWFVAMYMRHASGFTDRLLVHDNINRVAAGVHGDTGSIQYFVEQLGFGLFPWVGLVPAGLLAWVWMRSDNLALQKKLLGAYSSGLPHLEEDVRLKRQAEVLMLLGLWFFAAFALFSAMITKFHHYIFPAVPPAAILSGILLHRFFGQSKTEGPTNKVAPARKRRGWAALFLSFASPVAFVAGFGALYGDLRGLTPDSVEDAERVDWALNHGMGSGLGLGLILLGGAALAAAAWIYRKDHAKETSPQADISIAIAVAAGTVILAFVARDAAWMTSARPHGFERFIHLFVYNYSRPWPEYIDYRPILTGFGITATLLFAFMALRWTRAAAARAALAVALLFSAWSLNIYLPDLGPHWGMQNLFARYYEERSGPEEPVLAYQMNWKGENFYTGNRVHIFVDIETEKLREWIDANRGKTVFIVLEKGRLGSMRGVFRGAEVEELTDERFNNKFMLVRVTNI
jgi:4-amino-4-deoxy-L-arabinose transferase-like glycosyltransferase